ncbi:cobalt ABC transporter [Propionibacterium freudenreichii]|uniref:cobalt ABC transporter n=3 Tax=Propionibacterium freudenreichii TaxID=1744 RepID=UPI003854F92D
MATDMTLPDDLDRLVDRLVRDARGRRPVMVLDGGSGAGKTRLATRLVGALGERGMRGVQLVSMDSFYPGWDGLQAASAMLPEVLRVHDPGYWRWDWQAGRRTDRVGLDGDAPTLVEGCGALTAFSAGVGTTSMWFVMDAARRKQRALGRDGELYAPHWDRWAAQERHHWRRDRPRELADVILHDAG